jgi:uracil-DNA glycosylase family 4
MVPSTLPTVSRETRIALVGEAPGRTEIAEKATFVGPSGQLLDAILGQYGVAREEVFLTNACLCHYPESQFKKLPKEAIEACRPRLLAELEEVGATTVVPMGNSAVQSVFPPEVSKRGITSLRAGRPKRSTLLGDSTIVVPTFHPAFCLRAQERTPYLINDMNKAILGDNLPQTWYEPTVTVVDSNYSESGATYLLHRLTDLNRDEPVFLDIETGREKDVSFGNVHMEKMLCIGIGPSDPTNSDTVFVFDAEVFRSDEVRQAFIELLDQCRIVCQNGKFDLGALRAWLGLPEFRALVLSGDTMLQSYALNEYGGVHGLEYMGMEWLGCPDWKHEIEPYKRGEDGKGPVDYANIPRNILFKYNAFDVHVTRLLFGFFGEQIDALGLTTGYNFTLRASNMLTIVEPRGMGFDSEYSAKLSEEFDVEAAEIEATLPIVADPDSSSKKLREPHTLNCNSPKQVTQYFAAHGIELENTEADTLTELLTTLDPDSEAASTLQKILRIRGITKMDGTFVRGMRERVTEAGTVHPSFLLHGTTSGRLSARNPNSQNIPRQEVIKRQFVPRAAGRVLVGVDMSQAELRVLTWLAKEEITQEIFNDPTRDLFVELCRQMFPHMFNGQPDKYVKKHPIRPLVKGFAYGMAYGRTAAGIAKDPEFNMDVREAQRHMDTFQRTVPRITAYLEDVADRACRMEPLRTAFGRYRRFHLVTELNRHAVRNEAKAFPAQSTASDIVIEAACRLTFDHKVPIINLVHDAIYADVPEDEAPATRDLISSVMIEVGEEVTEGYVRFATEGKIGTSWDQV